ncbi:MAG: class I SAM-dependent methyltransferase [Acidimicrobiales bacterium]|nr:class I SAM-dependent methyltransferase [Acidimicrobiales bacterium]MBO0886409.1 class I SAM-dependent methyltransferase [Acidimicrobiales bacterium]
MGVTDDEELLAEQRSYYQALAPEYDEWWQRQGRWESGQQHSEEWHRQVALVDAALADFGANGDVLELAGGTGWWTERLAASADRLTVVDSSAEALALNRARVGRDDVEYEVADLFAWRPRRGFDVAFFSFWLSHVPRARFAGFWSLVRSCLKPGGAAFFIDNRDDPLLAGRRSPNVLEYRRDLHVRRLNDGTRYRVVKVMYEPDELRSLIEAEGWRADVNATRWFLFGSASYGHRQP